MKAAEIRDRFLAFFEARSHEVRPSSGLIPGDDPTLLFTNAGMVQFKNVFLGREQPGNRRAVTAQKCVRAGGKHNDLEQVGETTRHHTFFEMLGNFSFGDYFKEDAVRFAWDFLTEELGLDPDRIFVTVHHADDEAYDLWRDAIGVPESRIFRLGDRDNFWQMADTGPCGPCSELHYDLRAPEARTPPDQATFEELGEAGIFIELWNLVFMQFDRDADGVLNPLPAPSIDTGAGLERLAAVLQETDSNYHTDLFMPLLDRVGDVVGRLYRPDAPEGLSFRVLADHARAVAFLLADGVFPSNEGRGYVLRRILRRGVRHAWLLGRREPTLAHVVERVIDTMSPAYPELEEGRDHLLRTTRAEEERFLATIEGGMTRFDELAPVGTANGSGSGLRVLPGVEVFRLYDTFGFPVDLTELMARERGYEVDVAGFEAALEDQRARSRADRAASGVGGGHEEWLDDWDIRIEGVPQQWRGWDSRASAGRVAAVRADRGIERVGLVLEENPFYAEAGGQVADQGTVEGAGWRLFVDDVRKVEGRSAVFGRLEGNIPPGEVEARAAVSGGLRHDTERHHTATHLLHAALREVLGSHVTQRGSLVSPDRLRFDFSHPQPMSAEELSQVESRVNEAIWADHPVSWEVLPRDQAMARGAMALFGEKYGEEVRVVEIPGVSLELCGGTHLRHTGEAGLFRIVREAGVASGVRRLEAVTGRQAFEFMARADAELEELGALLKVSKDNLRRRTEQLLEERRELEQLLEELRRGGGTGETVIAEALVEREGGSRLSYRAVRMPVRDADDARALGDAFRAENSAGVLVVAAEGPEEKIALFVFVTDDLVGSGIRAGDLVREIAALAGGRGGGRPHMAQGGVEDPARVQEALEAGVGILAGLSGGRVAEGAGT
ncbi:MAG: alanine--tRNA ligase [Gemmatimonadales bacterium]|nr:MAG: alanine--tRNA ligase [Gemmatimonadales bacterium]